MSKKKRKRLSVKLQASKKPSAAKKRQPNPPTEKKPTEKKPAAKKPLKRREREVRVKTPEQRYLWRFVGGFIWVLAALVAVALASFNHAEASKNLVGAVGHYLVYGGYWTVGLAIWCLPVALLVGGLKLFEIIPEEVEEIPNGKIVLRVLGYVLIVVVVAGFFQLAGRWQWVQQLVTLAGVSSDAGGWVGRVFMTKGLERAVAAFGAFFLSLGLLALGLCMALGLKTFRRIFSWRFSSLNDWFEEMAETVEDGKAAMGKAVKKLAPKPEAPKPEEKHDEPEAEEPKVVRLTTKRPKIKYPDNPELPPLKLLDPRQPKEGMGGKGQELGEELMAKLKEFGVFATLSCVVEGPTVTQLEIKPGHGVRVEKIAGLSKDLQLALKAKSLRIFAPIPGKDAIGVQISNAHPQPVLFREIIESEAWQKNVTWPKDGVPKYPVPLLLGSDVAGEAVVADLTKMPHCLVAGATGRGKSVCLNSIINGLLMSRTPEQLRFILVDPKMVEFSMYAKLPHLLVPVVTEEKKALGALRWAAKEMERRLRLFSENGARDILEYNAAAEEKVPYIVVVIDELASLMTQCGHDVEPVLGRLMALARATGIHLILSTQRPDVKTISGTIKANIPGRIALGTTNVTDSRTILDESGAELLCGKGDMLYKSDEGLVRTQGSFISKGEMTRILDFVVKQWPAQFDESIVGEMENEEEGDKHEGGGGEDGVTEEEYEEAKRIVIEANRASISMLQQRMRKGYNHCARIINLLEKRGVVGPQHGAGPREVLVT